MTTHSDTEDDRLPRTVVPKHYELELSPDLEHSTFSGSEQIELEVLEAVDVIVCHAVELTVQHASVRPSGSTVPAELAAVVFDEARERVRFELDHQLVPGSYVLAVEFAGVLNDQLHGLYRSTFTDDQGTTKTMAVTQFEETDARRAFPCFDEPDRKATFSVTLEVDEALLAVSNARQIAEERTEAGRKRVRFARTIPMSTYLVAFVVGPLVATSAAAVNGIELRVIHAPGKEDLCSYALEVAAHSLRFFADYFAIPYPGDSYDLVAIPDFQAGAMENLGCVTFREAYLLIDPDRASEVELERVAEVIAHETAHMWFGDLVTMSWWNGIWLNEAFATYMSYLAQDDFRPAWKVFETLAADAEAAKTIDGLHTTRPIEFPVRTPDEASAMFDVLTYEKGGSVLRMLERYIGAERFRDGVRRYLSDHRYDNTETTDLWDALESVASDEPVRAMMDSWIFQGGYPYLEVGRAAAAGGGTTIEVRQHPFSYLAASERAPLGPDTPSQIGRSWLVPLTLAVRGTTDLVHREIVDEKGASLPGHDGTVVANLGGAGFYRVRYAPELAAELSNNLGALDAIERLCLLSDAWAFARAGQGELAPFLELIGRCGSESNPHVWQLIIRALRSLELVVRPSDRPLLEHYVRARLAPVLERLTFERQPSEDPRAATLRAELIAALGSLARDPSIIERCRALFAASREVPIDDDLAGAVLSVVASGASEAEYAELLERHRHPSTPQEEHRSLMSLTALTDSGQVQRTLELCLTELRTQDAPFVLGGLIRNPAAGPIAWDFLTDHFAQISERFAARVIPRLLSATAGLAQLEADNSAPLRDSVVAFCAAHPLRGEQRLIDQTLERLEIAVRFGQRQRDRIGPLLAGQR